MSKPAARVGDDVTLPHAPRTLTPGPGSVDVYIGNQPAWRANVDTFVCSTPIAPPAPAPHGPEKCYLGSLSVMINNQMAVRQGDILIGAGSPNPVLTGYPTVVIGDVGFGLADPVNMGEFCTDFRKLTRDWETLTPEQRRAQLESAINRQLNKTGMPSQKLVPNASFGPGNAQYDFSNGAMEISSVQLDAASMTPQDAQSLANVVYHEARHAEQWYLMARVVAAQGESATLVASTLGVPGSVARSAKASPLSEMSPQRNLGQSAYDSVYGSRGNYRNGVLRDVRNRYAQYRALPEEQDAWKTGDSLPCVSW